MINQYIALTLKVLNFWKFTSYCSLKPLWSGMGEVVPARASPTPHPPLPPTVHQLLWPAPKKLIDKLIYWLKYRTFIDSIERWGELKTGADFVSLEAKGSNWLLFKVYRSLDLSAAKVTIYLIYPLCGHLQWKTKSELFRILNIIINMIFVVEILHNFGLRQSSFC